MRETTRPTIYRTMKYWGKKPHNVWGSYIKKYCPRKGFVLDPFVGSGMTYFEAIKNDRIPITMDINPISDLSIKCLTNRKIEIESLIKEANKIIEYIKQQKYYIDEYMHKCDECGEKIAIYNYKKNGVYTVTYKCEHCKKIITKEIKQNIAKSYEIDKWVPKTKLSSIASISQSFIGKLKNDSISELWTNRNLKILSEIYNRILKVEDIEVKEMLVFAFLQCLHLTSKMCIPRNDKSGRPLSTSWGRPAYMLSKKTFEQNPLLAFEKAVFNGSGILKAHNSSLEYLGKVILKGNHYLGSSIDIIKKIENKSVDLIITDPPYGNIIQYGDLSEVWVSWLKKYNPEYKIDHKKEIIINKNKSIENYKSELIILFVELHRVLKDEGKFLITFNSNSKEDWYCLFYSLKEAGFCIDESLLQKNKRSSEANVSAKEGIAISDYYFLCKKGKWKINNIKLILERWGLEI